MLSTIHRAHLLLLADDHVLASHILSPDLRILRSLESVQEVRTERTVEIGQQSSDDGW